MLGLVALRRTAVASAVVAVAACLSLPSFAAGHGGAGPDAAADPRATLAAEQAEQLQRLPPETPANTCTATLEVEGLGRACRTDEGLFRVPLSSGGSLETHGGDAPTEERTAELPHLPESESALTNASVADVECVTGSGDKRVELVYAYPSDRANRSATLVPNLRQELYRASAFVDAESRAVDPSAGRRIRVLCDGSGLPVVHVVAMDPLGSATGQSFGAIVDQLVVRGFPTPSAASPSPRRVMAFYDAPSSSGAAGTGNLYFDDSPGAANYNNYGSRYAVEFEWSSSNLAHWDVMLHEMGHNMGAVADGAPDSSQAGHCNDGLDVMCYSDGGVGTYSSTVCSVERLDCGGDSYFNPAPAGGTWLATHWNLANVANHYLQARDLSWDDGGTPDVTPPGAPAPVSTGTPTNSTVPVSWRSVVDDRSQVSYVLRVDRWTGAAWENISTGTATSSTTATATGLAAGTQYRLRVRARDQAGNESADATATATTTAPLPSAPLSVTLALAGGLAIDATWTAGSGAGQLTYDASIEVAAGTWTAPRRIAGTTTRFDGLEAGRSYRVRVRTVDGIGQAGGWRTSTYVTTAGTLAGGGTDGAGDGVPAAPTVRVVAATTTSVTAAWADDVAVSSWGASITDVASGVRSSTQFVDAPGASFRGLRPGRAYLVEVVANAFDVSSAPGSVAARTLRDTRAPGAVVVAGGRFAAPGTWRLAWRAARDDVAVARYEVQRLRGGRWVRVARTGASARSTLVRDLRPRTTTKLRVRALDAAGNAGRWTAVSVTRR